MQEIKEDKLVKEVNGGFELIDLYNMQKITIESREVNKLFLQQLYSEKSRKLDGIGSDDMEKIEKLFFNERARKLEDYINGSAWRATLTSQGEEYIKNEKELLINHVKKYRELYPENTPTVIQLDKYKKIVIVDSEYNIEIFDMV